MKLPFVLLLMTGALTGCEDFDQLVNASQEPTAAELQQAALQAQYPADPKFFRDSIGNTVYFASDSSALNSSARATLAKQANWLKVNPNYTAVVEGYADEHGSRGYNFELVARRVDAVRARLMANGVPGSRIKFAAFGEEDPARLCNEPRCLADNRRAITVVVPDDIL